MDEPVTLNKRPWWDSIANTPGMLWALIIALLVFRLVWQWFSPYTLIEDEARVVHEGFWDE